MGNICSGFCSSDNEIALDLGLLQEMEQDLTHLDHLIATIDQRLQAIAAGSDRAQPKITSTQEAGSSSKFGSCINFGKDLVMKMSKHAERNRCVVCFKSAYNRDTRKVVVEVLKGASPIQLLGAGVCVVGYLLDQIEQISSNRDRCILHLRWLCALARRVNHLGRRIPTEIENLDKAVIFIFEGCVMCLTQMESHRLFRIFQASADAGDLQKLESKIQNTYADLTLGAVIQNTPYYPPPTQGQDPKPVGRDFAKDRIIKLLKMHPADDSRRAVVIYGFGGIGKTTIASAVYKTLNLKSYKFCRLDMDQNISNDGIKQLQQQMLRDLFGKGNILLNSYVEGQTHLADSFREHSGNRPIFLFIDNALEASNLAKLLPIDLSCLPNGMRILVTTRKLDQTDILSPSEFERIPFEVDVLSSLDAKKLLFKIALGSATASLPPGIESTDVDDIVEMCGGIPLLVELVAPKFKKHLSRASELKSLKEFLRGFVAAGRDHIERVVDQVFESLDELSKDDFLDIICFFDKEMVRDVSAAVGKVQLEVLLDAALVKLRFDDDDEKLWSMILGSEEERPQYVLEERLVRVHDIIKARGRWLSQQRQDRILDVESLKEALQDTQRLKKIKGIKISDSEESDELEIKAETLNITHSFLRVLELPASITVNGICNNCNFDSLHYLSVDGNLPIHPKQLSRLIFLRGTITENIDQLPSSLQMLSMKSSANLPSLPQSFDNLSSLRYLDLEGCNELESVPTSIGKLESLIHLNLSRCGNLTTLPENIQNLSALQLLDLSDCTQLTSLPPTFGQLNSLLLSNCSEFTFLPDSLGNLSTLQLLDLNKCEKLVELPKSFGALSALKYLDLNGCANLESFPESFGQLKSLKILNISSCQNLRMLNGGFESLTSLMVLVARNCNSLNEEAMDVLVEIKSSLFLVIDESASLIQRWRKIGQRYPLIVVTEDDDGFLHSIEHMLFHGGGRFVGLEGDGGQLAEWSWSCFAGEDEEQVEVEVSVLLTMCDLSLDCNNNALQIVKKEMERRMEESHRGGKKFQIVYAEAGDSMDKSEEHICQTLSKLLPSCTCACIPTDNKTSLLFAYALYRLLQPKSTYAIQSLHTCIFTLRVRVQMDTNCAKFQSQCFPNDEYEEALMDRGGGFNKLFSTIDLYSIAPSFFHR